MKTIALPSDDRAAWLEARRSGIGGSDAPAILGVSKWATPLDIFLDKRGLVADKPANSAMEWGTRLEPLVRNAYADATGRIVRVPTTILRHPLHPYMLGSIDGVTDDGRLVEIKTARSAEGWGEPGSDEVPDAYLVQVQHYLTVTGLSIADVAVLIGGSDFRLYEVPVDPELQNILIDVEGAFWDRVQRGDPPDPITYADAQKRWPTSRAQIVQASVEIEQAVQVLHAVKAEADAKKKKADALQATICAAMGENDVLVYGDVTLATWRGTKGAKFLDAQALERDLPDVYAKYLATREPVRRFTLK